MRKIFSGITAFILMMSLSACGVKQSDYDELSKKNEELQSQLDVAINKQSELEKQIADSADDARREEAVKKLKQQIDEIGEVTLEKEELISNLRAAYNQSDTKYRFHITNSDILRKAEHRVTDLKREKKAAEAKEAAAQAAAAEEEKLKQLNQSIDEYKESCKTYDYKELARNPSGYIGEKVKFTGEVIQVQESVYVNIYRINVTEGDYGFWEDTLYVTYTPEEDTPRILENDIITLYGEMEDLMTYETVLGSTATLPSMTAKYIDIN